MLQFSLMRTVWHFHLTERLLFSRMGSELFWYSKISIMIFNNKKEIPIASYHPALHPSDIGVVWRGFRVPEFRMGSVYTGHILMRNLEFSLRIQFLLGVKWCRCPKVKILYFLISFDIWGLYGGIFHVALAMRGG